MKCTFININYSRSQLQEASKEEESLEVHIECSLQADEDTCEPQESIDFAADEESTFSLSGEVPCQMGEADLIHLPVNKLKCDKDASGQLSPGNQVQGGEVPCLIREAELIHLPVNEFKCDEDASCYFSRAGKGEKKNILKYDRFS